MSELLGGDKVCESDALVHLVEESDFVKGLLQVPTIVLVIHERLTGQQVQVLLEGLSDKLALESLEEAHLCGLGLEQGKHAPGDTDDWEVLRLIQVVLTGPHHDLTHFRNVLLVFEALLGVAWNVDTIEIGEFFLQLLLRLHVVNRDDACASCLEEVGVRGLEEALVLRWELAFPLLGEWLCKHTEDGLVGLGTHVVT